MAGQTKKMIVLAATVAVLLFLLWHTFDILLLVFAGVLLAIFLRSMSDLLSDHTPLGEGPALLAVCLALLALIGGGLWLLAPIVGEQASALGKSLPEAVDQLRARAGQQTWAKPLVDGLSAPQEAMGGQQGLLSRVSTIFSSTLNALTNLGVILFVGIYLAANPTLYQRGLLYLVPPARRRRAEEILETLAFTLRRWLVGQLIAMVMISVLISLGLWLLGVPMALVLGIIAGLMEFIPNFGPIVAAVPALLLALIEGPSLALAVLALYIGVQLIESYLIQPLIQQKAVELPPALLIMGLVLFGTLFGFLGLLLATPLSAAILVLVKMIYVEDILEDHSIKVKGEDEARREAGKTLSELELPR